LQFICRKKAGSGSISELIEKRIFCFLTKDALAAKEGGESEKEEKAGDFRDPSSWRRWRKSLLGAERPPRRKIRTRLSNKRRKNRATTRSTVCWDVISKTVVDLKQGTKHNGRDA